MWRIVLKPTEDTPVEQVGHKGTSACWERPHAIFSQCPVAEGEGQISLAGHLAVGQGRPTGFSVFGLGSAPRIDQEIR